MPLRSFIIIIAFYWLLGISSSASPLNAMSWNIRWFPGGYQDATLPDQSNHLKSAREILRKSDPDLLLAQEIRDETSITQLIAPIRGMKTHIITGFIDFDTKKAAPQQCVIASKLEARSAWQENYRFAQHAPGIQRGFAVAALKHPSGRGLIMVYCVHLRSNRGSETPDGEKKIAAIRAESVRQIIAHTRKMKEKFAPEPIMGWVIGGDFNTNHDGQFPRCTAIGQMEAANFHNSWNQTPRDNRLTWRNHPKFEDFIPTTFDYIFTAGFRKNQATLLPDVPLSISDHAPVLLRLE